MTNTEFLRFDDKTMPVPVFEIPKVIDLVTPITPKPAIKVATAGNDKLTGTVKSDTLNGLEGNDILIGGNGADKLTGGLGKDVFKFNNVKESGITDLTQDTIMDFNHQDGDKIDLSSIDANIKLAGNQAFKFIGTKEFSNTNASAQLRFDATTHILYGSNDADNAPEFSIQLSGINSLVAGDFVL